MIISPDGFLLIYNHRFLWHWVRILLLLLQVVLLLPVLRPPLLLLRLLCEIPETPVQEVSVQRIHRLHRGGQPSQWLQH